MLHSVEKQHNVDEWKTASTQAQTYRSRDAACTGVWTTEVSQWGLGAVGSKGLATKHKSSKNPQKQMQATYTMSERGHWT